MRFPRVDTVLVFKNGNSVIRKTIALPPSQTTVQFPMPSSSVHGTFWVTCSPRVRISSLKSIVTSVDADIETACHSLESVVSANIGRGVVLFLRDCQLRGVLRESASSSLVVLEAESGQTRVFPISKVESVASGDEIPLRLTVAVKTSRKVVEVEYSYEEAGEEEEEAGEIMMENATVCYVLKGCTWAPSYFLSLNTETHRACFRMQSCILNDAEPFRAGELVCAAGSPRQKYNDVQDPFVHGQGMDEFFRSLGVASRPGGRGYGGRRQIMNQAITSNMFIPQQQVALPPGGGSSSAPSEDGVGSNATDWYYYTFENMAVERGQRMLLPVFRMDLPYSELYKVTLVKQDEALSVVHCVKIRNESDFIWTTAPVTISSEKQLFAGQSMIGFTTKGMDSLVEIADALSIRVKYNESVEVDQRVTRTIHASRYVQATVSCAAEITNFQGKEVKIRLDSGFVGKFVEASVDPLSQNTEFSDSRESEVSTKLVFELDLAEGATTELKFSYTKWVSDRGVY